MKFQDSNGTFSLENAENSSYLYLPVAGTTGLKSSFTPTLGGDSKLDQNTFLLEPVSAENLHNNKSVRNFWCRIQNKGCWSANGGSAEAENDHGTEQQDESVLTAGYMWQKTERRSKRYALQSEITSFIPLGTREEVLYVKIRNTASSDQTITPIAAIPLFGRSAENIRDHRHVTSLLHRISTDDYSVKVKPTMSFDERGHQENDWTYYVCGVTAKGEKPEVFYPYSELFLGEGGSYAHPGAVYGDVKGVSSGFTGGGKEAVGGIEFAEITLRPGEEAAYIIASGLTKEDPDGAAIAARYASEEKTSALFEEMKAFWEKSVNVKFHSGDPDFDSYMSWVNFQPMLRRIYGCSFLPYHDYGKGGRGWRDLWQDCLALLFMNPGSVRAMILNNFAGVRMDGTNATIIGEKAGEFLADRNHITRVWMDHAFWPFLTVRLYIDQTGDFAVFDEMVTFFKDRQSMRGQESDAQWEESGDVRLKDADGNDYLGSVLEHLLVQNLCAFYDVGEHNHLRLRNADWNDALDMAEKHGESVAFSCAYAGNLQLLAAYAEKYQKYTNKKEIMTAEEFAKLLDDESVNYEDPCAKQDFLKAYAKSCSHSISGRKVSISITQIAAKLRRKAEWMTEHIRKTEWVGKEDGPHWYNGYYDDHGRQVEGWIDERAKMMLTGQTFSIMSGVADKQQVAEICESADRFLFSKESGGYRLNTDFGEVKMDLGRMFGFAYGTKENGAVFSHMAVMYANALYQRGFIKEGHCALQSLMDASMNFESSRIYPGLPEYFDERGRGMYHYLTGAASWYMLTMITQVYGIHGDCGNMVISPKLMAKQFNSAQQAKIELPFADRNFEITICNPENCECGEYEPVSCSLNGAMIGEAAPDGYTICRSEIEKLEEESVHRIVVMLGKKKAKEKCAG